MKMTDLLLIQPPELSRTAHGTLEQFSDIDVGKYPPLGLMYVAAFIEKHSDFKVEILDADSEGLSPEEMKRRICDTGSLLVGIYTTSFTISDSLKVARIAKEANRGIKVILGGPHLDIYPEESIRLSNVDFIVMGEGEQTALELLIALKNKKGLNGIKGIGYKDEDGIRINERRPLIKDLDEIPFPARKKTKYHMYNSLIGEAKVATTIISSRGCPNKCAFCNIPYNGTLRLRSSLNVLDEMEGCLSMGIREFFFFDENFTISKRHVIDFCQGIEERKLKIKFFIRSRIDTLDEEMAHKLKAAGCRRIQFGVESGSQRILDRMNKGTTTDRIRKTFTIAKRACIPTYADFMIGYPGETEEDIKKTFDLCREIDPDYLQLGITMYMPNIKIYGDALKSGLLKKDVWKELAKDPDQEFTIPLASQLFRKEQLDLLQRQGYFRFYLRPKFIIKTLLRARSLRVIKSHFKAGISLLRFAINK